ncbi:MAG: PilZ domain-containing protein [Oligoflexales bacterium]|nr:PilZ domain-containing protein [Oligoflexales bacterium]
MSAKDLLATPYFEKHRSLATQIFISDISVGGICLKTYFPSISSKLSEDLVDEKAKITFPLRTQMEVGLNIRWIKRINEHIKVTSTRNNIKTFYLIGCQFTEAPEELMSEIKRFIKLIQEAGLV